MPVKTLTEMVYEIGTMVFHENLVLTGLLVLGIIALLAYLWKVPKTSAFMLFTVTSFFLATVFGGVFRNLFLIVTAIAVVLVVMGIIRLAQS